MGGCLGLFLDPLVPFVTHPFLGFLPATLFLVYYFARRPAAEEQDAPSQVLWNLLACVAWLGFALYEIAMNRWSRGVAGAPIRADLFLVAPALYGITALALGVAVLFEMKVRGVVAASIPDPSSRQRDRASVIRIAILLVAYPLLDLMVLIGLGGHDLRNKLIGLLLVLFFAVFLVRGYSWARWCLVLWLAYSAFFCFIGWSSLRAANRPGLENYRRWDLAAAVFAVALGVTLVVSKRLRDHLAAARLRSPMAS